MTVSASSFVALYPEFAPWHAQHSTLIAATLAEVELYVSDSWGDSRDEIVSLECAARLASGPQGRAAQLLAKDGTSTYSRLLERRKLAHACCYGRVA